MFRVPDLFAEWEQKYPIDTPGYQIYNLSDVSLHNYEIYSIFQGKRGKRRTIEEPREPLKSIQRDLVRLFEQFPLRAQCMARKGKSIMDNAEVHKDARYILKVDISDCYRSIRQYHISCALMMSQWWSHALASWLNPFDNHQAQLMDRILRICMLDGYLPTGAPTSPILCNIALTPIDDAVQALALEYGYKYTRYIDDLHLSTTSEKRSWELIDEVKAILVEQGFRPHARKTKWLTNNSNDKVIVTGIRIGQQSKVPREYMRIARARVQNLAMAKKPIDRETAGCLAHIRSLDESKYLSLMEYYNRRLNYVPSNGKRSGTEQVLLGSTGDGS